jgi:hypothetical protein
MTFDRGRSVPLLLWPFHALVGLLAFVLEATGRLVCAALGFVSLGVGVLLTLTLIGAPIGVPMAVLGLLLLVRSIF